MGVPASLLGKTEAFCHIGKIQTFEGNSEKVPFKTEWQNA